LLSSQAEADYQRALALQPLQRSANMRMGWIAWGRMDFESAVRYLAAAHRAEPDHYATRKSYALACAFLGQEDLALELLSAIPDGPDQLLVWANYLYETGQWRYSRAAYRTLLRYNPDSQEIQARIAAIDAQP
jgi:tetratricopeptide (TPR) repeat protein